ncbi:transporter [Plakobranchus ocellatus]|uniref:Transporter n=1 Tax=Plakobranchus ocellatus TaxID=259542 RepID=A0AAV3Z2D9_9GAST|nr:transporter [Plakobranchus ocellatus]
MFVDYRRSTYDDYTYPVWADVLGWFFTLVSVMAIPLFMLYLLQKETEGDNLLEKLRLLSLPTVYWGPALQKHRTLVTYVDGFQVDPSKGLKPLRRRQPESALPTGIQIFNDLRSIKGNNRIGQDWRHF